MRKIISVMTLLCLLCGMMNACAASNPKKEESLLVLSYDSTYSMDASVVRAYEQLCQAVLAGEKEVRISAALRDDALRLFYTSFPLSAIVKDVVVKEDNSGIELQYQKKHASMVADFEKKIEDILAECQQNAGTNTAFAVNAYHYVASHIQQGAQHTCYAALTENSGDSFAYAALFEYLLQQKGIPAYHILGADAAGNPWGLSMAELNGEVYYFDVMSEYDDNGGELLRYFGMTTEDVIENGIKTLQLTNQKTPQDASDMLFEACRFCRSWELQGNRLLVTNYNDVFVEIAL